MFNKQSFNKFFDKKDVKMIEFNISIAGAVLAGSLGGLSWMIAAAGGSIIAGGGSTTIVIEGGASSPVINSTVASALGAAEAGGFCGGLDALLAAGAISIFLCWVAREVYGQDNIKWQLFRSWMLNQSPKWFLKLYINHGENTAKFLKNKTILKNAIKICMDYIISNKLKAEYNFAV